MQPRDLLTKNPQIIVSMTDLMRAQLEVLLSIDDRLARMEEARRQQREDAAAVIAGFEASGLAGPSVPMSALAEPFDPLRDCEQERQELERMGLDPCQECGHDAIFHREAAGEPPDQPGSDAT